MASILEAAIRWMHAKQAKCLTLRGIYHSLEHGDKTVPFVLGRSTFRAQNDYGIVITTEVTDFIINLRKLEGEPKRGDIITWRGQTFEVLAPNNEPVWRWSGPFQDTYRVHTKYIGPVKTDEKKEECDG